MGDVRRYPRKVALAVAKELCDALRPAVDTGRDGKPLLLVAGSLRRLEPEVDDVEILYVSRMEERPDKGSLFPEQDRVRAAVADDVICGLLRRWVLKKREKEGGGYSWGERHKLAVHIVSRIPVELISLTLENWWSGVVCRTGTAENTERIYTAANRRGWTWNPYGAGFYAIDEPGVLRHRVQNEQDVFKAVGLPYQEPKNR